MSAAPDLRKLPEDAAVEHFRTWVNDAAEDTAEVVLPYDTARLLLDALERRP